MVLSTIPAESVSSQCEGFCAPLWPFAPVCRRVWICMCFLVFCRGCFNSVLTVHELSYCRCSGMWWRPDICQTNWLAVNSAVVSIDLDRKTDSQWREEEGRECMEMETGQTRKSATSERKPPRRHCNSSPVSGLISMRTFLLDNGDGFSLLFSKNLIHTPSFQKQSPFTWILIQTENALLQIQWWFSRFAEGETWTQQSAAPTDRQTHVVVLVLAAVCCEKPVRPQEGSHLAADRSSGGPVPV